MSYSDQRQDCAWTLQADIQARQPRRVWDCSVSFQFPGVPLDTDPLRSLLGSMGLRASGHHFRPRADEAVTTWAPPRKPADPRLHVTGYVVEQQEEELLVRGVLARNPFRRARARESVPGELAETSHMILPLRSWHGWGDRPAAYRLVRAEWMRSTDVLVASAMADWDDPLQRA